MPPAASPFALTTPAAFLDYFGEPSDDDGRNADRAQTLINGYSKAVRKYTRRQFKPVEAAADKIFRYRGDGYLSFGKFEATAVNSVTLYTDLATESWVVLANQSSSQQAGYRANPANGSDEGTFWALDLPELGRFHPYYDAPTTLLQRFEYQVTVNADWGVGEVPEDVELAVWIAVANAWRNPEGFQSRNLGPLGSSDYEGVVPGEEEGLSLPRASRALLSGYRRRNGVR